MDSENVIKVKYCERKRKTFFIFIPTKFTYVPTEFPHLATIAFDLLLPFVLLILWDLLLDICIYSVNEREENKEESKKHPVVCQ